MGQKKGDFPQRKFDKNCLNGFSRGKMCGWSPCQVVKSKKKNAILELFPLWKIH